MKYAKTPEGFIEKQTTWKEGLIRLREIMLSTGMEETIKWGIPVYCVNGKNVVGIGAFKSYFGLWFYNGALLEDKAKKLMNAQEGVTKALRQWRFTSLEELDEKLVLDYVKEAIQNQKEGREIKAAKPTKEVDVPKYFTDYLKASDRALENFKGFSPSKQKEYVEWVTEAKTEPTRQKRMQTSLEWLEEGKPRNWKYMKEWK